MEGSVLEKQKTLKNNTRKENYYILEEDRQNQQNNRSSLTLNRIECTMLEINKNLL